MTVRFDVSAARRQAARLGATARQIDQLETRAVGTLRRRLLVEARRDIQTEYNLPAARIAAGLRTRDIAGGVELIGAKRGIGKEAFGGKWGGRTSPGATAAIRKDEGRQTYAHAFLATLLGGNRQIVQRKGAPRRMKAGRYKGQVRQPLAVEYGPSIAQMLRRPERRERLGAFAQSLLSDEIARLLRGL